MLQVGRGAEVARCRCGGQLSLRRVRASAGAFVLRFLAHPSAKCLRAVSHFRRSSTPPPTQAHSPRVSLCPPLSPFCATFSRTDTRHGDGMSVVGACTGCMCLATRPRTRKSAARTRRRPGGIPIRISCGGQICWRYCEAQRRGERRTRDGRSTHTHTHPFTRSRARAQGSVCGADVIKLN